ncbi:LEA type 2 family protein [Archangium lipolyticum]|uniref:LEA type 2 family protein n=1 Tax=Archangium lipolyticum TaxID=2970465 RepID=UPI00214A2B51|nr:LEA type 2 family protein [Archangium lipolyticum]
MRSAPRAIVHILTLAAWVAGCASTPPAAPEGGPASLEAQETTVASQGLTEVTLRYAGQLTSPGPAVLEKADYELVSEGQVVEKGSAPLGVALAPGAPTPFSFQAGAAYVRGEEDLRAMSQRGGTVLLALRGVLTVRSGETVRTLPFAASRQVRVPRLPEVRIESLEGARYSEEKVDLLLRLGVRNPNPFPLRLDGLRWAITVGGRKLGEGTQGKYDTVDAAATGVYPVELAVTTETWGQDVRALIAKGTLPYEVAGELTGPLVRVPYSLSGDVKLNVSR